MFKKKEIFTAPFAQDVFHPHDVLSIWYFRVCCFLQRGRIPSAPMLLFVSLSRCQSRSARLSSSGCFLLDTQPPLKDTTPFDAFGKKKRKEKRKHATHTHTQSPHHTHTPPPKKSSLSLAKNLASEKSVGITRRLEESENDVSPSAHHSGTSAACQKACVCVYKMCPMHY